MTRRRLMLGGVVAALAVGLLIMASVLGGSGGSKAVDPAPSGSNSGPGATAVASTDPIGADIVKQQTELRDFPANYQAWASLGLDYVQQAKVTINPAYYPKAQGALARSLQLNTTENYVAMAGMAALTAAEHNFTAARMWAQRGLRIDAYSATLYGALDDADTQLGLYAQAAQAAQKMDSLQPGVPSSTRLEYVYELRGDLRQARAALERALQDADNPADTAFIYYYLGELAFNSGDPKTALADNNRGLKVDPSYPALLEGKAKAEAALGQSDAAVRDYLTVVGQVPQPQYVVEAGELLQSLHRTTQAQQQYSLFDTENRLFQANGVTLDTDPTLFYADHGQPQRAVAYGIVGIKIRPFIEMDDAYAWALHADKRDSEALSWEHKAMALGTRNALFFFHTGIIEKSLGHNQAAKSDLTTALAINPYFSPLQVPVARAALRSLGGP